MDLVSIIPEFLNQQIITILFKKCNRLSNITYRVSFLEKIGTTVAKQMDNSTKISVGLPYGTARLIRVNMRFPDRIVMYFKHIIKFTMDQIWLYYDIYEEKLYFIIYYLYISIEFITQNYSQNRTSIVAPGIKFNYSQLWLQDCFRG